MKPNTIKAIIHVWGLLWIVGLSFYLFDHNKAAVVVICALPVNYWLSNGIFKSIFNKTKKDQ